jgi:hypothetical protein
VRVLFASTQGAGHLDMLVPFIEACLRDGHEVLIVGPPTLDARGYPLRVGAAPPRQSSDPCGIGCRRSHRAKEMSWSSA